MTIFFASTTAVCLIGLAVFAAHQDASSRTRVDDRLVAQAKQIALGLDVDEDGLIFSTQPQRGKNLDQVIGLRAIGVSPAAVIVQHRVDYAEPQMDALPSMATIERLTAKAERGTAAFTTATAIEGGSVRWVAVPVSHSDGTVVVLGDRSNPAAAHDTVVLGLSAAVVGLVAAATLAGHLLSGLAMRPAVRSSRQQEQFLREAAHELRTPLATISLVTEAGLRDPDTAFDALQAAHQRLGQLNLLVGSLLVRARARARADAQGSEVERRSLRLDQLVELTIEELGADDRVRVDISATVVLGNAELIGQAVRNLVENALRHAPESSVLVTVRETQLIVEDDGRGAWTASDKDHRDPTRGTGTGLAIVEWVAHVHGATFSLAPAPNGGMNATFDFHPRDDRPRGPRDSPRP